MRSLLVKLSVIFGVGLVIGAGLLFAAAQWYSADITKAIEGEAFRQELDKQTAKGLHFQTGTYGDIHRTGFLSAECPTFSGMKGEKAMQMMEARNIKATFNPWGVFLRRWQLDSVHIESGKIEIQKYEPKPVDAPKKPWYAIFLPDRVYLKEVICETADITWQIQNKKAGIFDTRLRITPHGRDFNYFANGGKMRMGLIPELPLEQIRMLITKEKLTLYELELAPAEESYIRVSGEAGLKEDKSMEAKGEFSGVPIAPWVPTSWGDQVKGTASGHVLWKGKDQKVESSEGSGEINLSGTHLISIPFFDYVASATRNEDLKSVELDRCVASFSWDFPSITVKQIDIEADGEFALNGSIEINDGRLGGTIRLGLSPKNLEWLPKAKEEIFTKSSGGYVWTDVRLSGTVQAPEDDLTPRLASVLKRSPGPATGLFFRGMGEWFKQTFSRD